MARTKRSEDLGTRNKRLHLYVGVDATETLAEGRYLLYHRPQNGASGSWTARWYDSRTRKIKQAKLGIADDFTDADGVKVLDYAQACAKAGKWCKEQEGIAHAKETGDVVHDGGYTVAEALQLYLKVGEREGLRGLAEVRSMINRHLLPEFGTIEVSKLGKARIEDWMDRLSRTPRRKTGRNTSVEGQWADGGQTPDKLRARKVTVNRVLAVLKRALALACAEKGIQKGSWVDVMPFRKVKSARKRFLNLEEQQKLVGACSDWFRPLVVAALYTGSRYSPLTKLQVRDFDPAAGTLFIEMDKAGSSRYIHLAPNAVEWFSTQTEGRGPSDLLFPRDRVRRQISVQGEDGVARNEYTEVEKVAYARGDQLGPMDAACEAAGISRVTFHELRHTYAAGLVNSGVPLSYVADQLGHVDTRMVEQFYGHLCPSAKAEAIRTKAPDPVFGGSERVIQVRDAG